MRLRYYKGILLLLLNLLLAQLVGTCVQVFNRDVRLVLTTLLQQVICPLGLVVGEDNVCLADDLKLLGVTLAVESWVVHLDQLAVRFFDLFCCSSRGNTEYFVVVAVGGGLRPVDCLGGRERPEGPHQSQHSGTVKQIL